MRNKFFNYLDSLERKGNEQLIESVKAGFDAIYEQLIMTPIPKARITDWGEEESTEPIAEKWNTNINRDNEYFDQTLPDWVLNITNNSYFGHRQGAYPKPNRTHFHPDGDKHLSGSWGDSTDGEYAGDSYGYNLGGPSEAG